jgi:hypothetical protein
LLSKRKINLEGTFSCELFSFYFVCLLFAVLCEIWCRFNWLASLSSLSDAGLPLSGESFGGGTCSRPLLFLRRHRSFALQFLRFMQDDALHFGRRWPNAITIISSWRLRNRVKAVEGRCSWRGRGWQAALFDKST